MSATQNAVFTLLALLAGASFVVQQAVNSNLSASIGSTWWAGFASYLGGTLVMLLLILLLREPAPNMGVLGGAVWWSWTGGFFGAVYIAVAILLLPRQGAFTVISLIVAGQLAASLLLDHFGVLGVARQPVTLARLLGGAFLLAGAILVRR